MMVRPFNTTGSVTRPENLSPGLLVRVDSAVSSFIFTAVPTGSANCDGCAVRAVVLCRAGGASLSSVGALTRAALGFDQVVDCASDTMGSVKARSSTEYLFIQSSELFSLPLCCTLHRSQDFQDSLDRCAITLVHAD